MPPVQPVIREHPFLPCSSAAKIPEPPKPRTLTKSVSFRVHPLQKKTAAKKNPVQPVIPEHPAHYEL